MRLTDIQRDVVARHLRSKLGDKPYEYLEGLFGEDASRYIVLQKTPHAYALEMLRVCEERWRQGDRRWCLTLWESTLAEIQEVQDVFKVHQALLEQEDRLRQELVAADPFTDMLVCRRNAFLNRRRLRESLKKLAAEDGPSILVVDGPARSGRSYTRTLIQHISEKRDDFQVAWNVCSGPGSTLEVRGLANTFSLTVGRPPGPMPERDAQEPRWAQQLAQWVLGHDVEAGSRWWLVFDGFDGTEVATGARSFIESLAQRIATGPARKRFRLILLQYPHPLPLTLRRETILEKLQAPEALGESDVREFFEWLFRKRNEAFTSEALQALVQDVMARIPPAEDCNVCQAARVAENKKKCEDRLQHLCTAVEDVTDSLLEEA